MKATPPKNLQTQGDMQSSRMHPSHWASHRAYPRSLGRFARPWAASTSLKIFCIGVSNESLSAKKSSNRWVWPHLTDNQLACTHNHPGYTRIDYCFPNQDSRDWGMGRMWGNLIAVGACSLAESGGGKAVVFDFLVPVMYKCKWRAGRFVPPQSDQIEGTARAVCQVSRATVPEGFHAHHRRAAQPISHRRLSLP